MSNVNGKSPATKQRLLANTPRPCVICNCASYRRNPASKGVHKKCKVCEHFKRNHHFETEAVTRDSFKREFDFDANQIIWEGPWGPKEVRTRFVLWRTLAAILAADRAGQANHTLPKGARGNLRYFHRSLPGPEGKAGGSHIFLTIALPPSKRTPSASGAEQEKENGAAAAHEQAMLKQLHSNRTLLLDPSYKQFFRATSQAAALEDVFVGWLEDLWTLFKANVKSAVDDDGKAMDTVAYFSKLYLPPSKPADDMWAASTEVVLGFLQTGDNASRSPFKAAVVRDALLTLTRELSQPAPRDAPAASPTPDQKSEEKKTARPGPYECLFATCWPDVSKTRRMSITQLKGFLDAQGLPHEETLKAVDLYFTTDEASNPQTSHKPLVVNGPSGVGKGTLLDMLFKDFPGKFSRSVSHTTRSARPGEEHGVHYYFTDREKFKEHVRDGLFIEHAEFSGNMYGTSIMAVEDIKARGQICILEIDIQGAEIVRHKTSLDPTYVFIYPPSFQHLESRLRDRNTETPESLQKRLDAAKHELDLRAKTPEQWDIHVENSELYASYHVLRENLLKIYPHLREEHPESVHPKTAPPKKKAAQ